MYALSAAVAINPPGVSPVLTADQVWRGLVMKAENALPFVEAMEACRVVERFDDGFVREIVLRGVPMRERITLAPPVQVHFRRLEAHGYDGWITNVISESDNGLLLVFTFCVGFPDAAPGSVDERRRGDAVKASYVSAITSTLKAVRTLVDERRTLKRPTPAGGASGFDRRIAHRAHAGVQVSTRKTVTIAKRTIAAASVRSY